MDEDGKLIEAALSRTDVKSLQQRIVELELLVEQQRYEMEKTAASTFLLPTGRPVGGKQKSAYCRIIIPDSHGAFIDEKACKAFLADLEAIDPGEVVFLGDHLDCSGFLAEHMTLAYVAEGDYAFADDVSAANQFLDAVQSRSPKAVFTYLEGNHERRISRWIITQTRRHGKDARYLSELFSAEAVLHAEKRNMRWIRQGEFYDNLPLPATIRLGKCYFTHGEYSSRHAAKAHLDKYAANVVYGHTHRADQYTRRTVSGGIIGAWCPGCLCQLQRLWNHTNLTDWSHGYGLQAVMPNGAFLGINVPIIEGISYLRPLTRSLAT